jgi:hypothetical protein
MSKLGLKTHKGKISKSQLVSIEKKRRKPGAFCHVCEQEIPIGDKYQNVQYNDGITFAIFGYFHNDCWSAFNPKPL